MRITAEMLRRISKGKTKPGLVAGIVSALDTYGPQYGLDQPHRIAHFLPQLAHESGGFQFDREIWGPTAAQKGYEGRKDLGNIQKGDGSKYRGYGPIQVTGRHNVTAFQKWCKSEGMDPPDFVAHPELMTTDPWSGISAIWYWEKGNPDGKSLNRYADRNDIEIVTRKINGGTNGLSDRMDYYDRTALVLLGYAVNAIRPFQEAAKARGDYSRPVDGESGPATRAAMHKALVRLTEKVDRAPEVAAAPVTEKQPVAVPVKELEKPAWQSPEVLIPAAAPVATGVGSFLSGADWRVAIAVVVVAAAFAAWLIIRRDRMKTNQAAKVEAIEAKETLR